MSTARKAPLPYFDTLAALLESNQAAIPPSIASLTPDFQRDYQLARAFLLSYQDSLDTFNAYRREIERFLQWSQWIACCPLKNIRREEFAAYLDFCQKPPLSWIGMKNEPRFVTQNNSRIPNKKWRPFVATLSKTDRKAGLTTNKKTYQLSRAGFKVIFAVIGSFYQFLIQENYTLINPVSLIRQKSRYLKTQKAEPRIRRLSELQWGYVLETAELAANKTPKQHERTLFILNALYGMYLRISELAATERWTPTMGDFERDPEGHWWFHTVSKGNKSRKIAVSDALLKALKRYRKSRQLPILPVMGEETPLIPQLKSNEPVKSIRYLRFLVQEMFDAAAMRLQQDNQAEEAAQLAAATVHWLRHTGISDDVKVRPREHVRDDAGHSSSAITDKYIDIELRERHASGRKKRIKPNCMLDD